MKIQCVDVAAKSGNMFISALGPMPIVYESVHEVEDSVGEVLLRNPKKWRKVIIRKKAKTGETTVSIPLADSDLTE